MKEKTKLMMGDILNSYKDLRKETVNMITHICLNEIDSGDCSDVMEYDVNLRTPVATIINGKIVPVTGLHVWSPVFEDGIDPDSTCIFLRPKCIEELLIDSLSVDSLLEILNALYETIKNKQA